MYFFHLLSRTSRRPRGAGHFFARDGSRTRSDREGLEISALRLEETLARHLGHRHSDDRNADHNKRLHHVGDRSHFGTRRTSSSFGPPRSSLTHLRRRERVPTVDTPPLKDNNRVWLMLAAVDDAALLEPTSNTGHLEPSFGSF